MDCETLETQFLGQTASHSFANDITLSDDSESFICLDVGDGYPRGV